ncbi:MAG: LysM domain-containing protein [Candidatus Auribacterota bacterium]|nr:LysM domain-containing protein [Candidatus Auribacterota bacterium]
MKITGIITLSVALILLFSGCRTTRTQQREAKRKQWEDTTSRRIVDNEQRVFELERSLALNKRQQDSLDRRLTGIENRLASTSGNYKSEVDALRKELKDVRGASEKKIDIIMDEVARENQRILQSIRSNRGSAGYAQGYEHVVKSGESLSTIAREYKVTVDVIVDANQLANPNAIRVGQILFIPQ